MGGEYRAVRVGDTVYKNQPFMILPDLSEWAAYLDVPEAELAYAREGAAARIYPLALPGLCLTGRVEIVGTMAQLRGDRVDRRKYFKVTVALVNSAPALRPGMSARVAILADRRDTAVLIPRTAVRWDGAQPWCEVAQGGRVQKRTLRLGPSDETRFSVESGLAAGERVRLP
jgi:multidrug efflux pump subunit AcrA (membrane-fusion protein)